MLIRYAELFRCLWNEIDLIKVSDHFGMLEFVFYLFLHLYSSWRFGLLFSSLVFSKWFKYQCNAGFIKRICMHSFFLNCKDSLRSISFSYPYFLKVEMDFVNLCQSISINSDSSAQEPAHGARATGCTSAESKKTPPKQANKQETRS